MPELTAHFSQYRQAHSVPHRAHQEQRFVAQFLDASLEYLNRTYGYDSLPSRYVADDGPVAKDIVRSAMNHLDAAELAAVSDVKDLLRRAYDKIDSWSQAADYDKRWNRPIHRVLDVPFTPEELAWLAEVEPDED
jgi:hypothetical protein